MSKHTLSSIKDIARLASMATMFAFNRFISISALVACVASLYLAIEVKSGGIDIRNLMREAWPLPRSVVLHKISAFGPDNGMYKFHTGVSDVEKFSEYLYKEETINSDSWNTLKLMQYASGCMQDNEYVQTSNNMQLIAAYDATVPTSFKGTLPLRSVCNCLANIEKVVGANITQYDLKTNFEAWLKEGFDREDANYIVMAASEALTSTTSAEYKNIEAQAAVFQKIAKEDKKEFIAKASERCFLSSQPEYVQEYAGQIDTKILIFNGIMLLIFGVLGSVFKFPSEQSGDKKEYMMLWAISICYYVYFVLALVWTFNVSLREHVFGSIWRSFDKATSDDSSVINPTNTVQIVYDTILLIVLGLLSFICASQQLAATFSKDDKKRSRWYQTLFAPESAYFPHSDNLMWKCVQNDLPYIAGYASIGIGLLIANGLTNANSVLFAFLLLISIGFIQHISNVNKIIYDALCQNTKSEEILKLTREGGATPITDSNVQHMKDTLMFFGWTRVFWFIIIFGLTFSLLTFTRETSDHTQFTSFLNSHVFWFVLALFWANVGYDVLRELLPFQFERTPANQHKVIITASYLLFLTWSLSSLMYQISHKEHQRHLFAH